MSGRHCLLFFVDKDRTFSKAEAREYWRRCGKDTSARPFLWDTLPYDNSEIYWVAERLGIPKDSLPCLVLFRNFNESEKAVFPLDPEASAPELTRRLQEIFTVIDQAASELNTADADAVWDSFVFSMRRHVRYRESIKKYGELILIAGGIAVGAVMRGLTKDLS